MKSTRIFGIATIIMMALSLLTSSPAVAVLTDMECALVEESGSIQTYYAIAYANGDIIVGRKTGDTHTCVYENGVMLPFRYPGGGMIAHDIVAAAYWEYEGVYVLSINDGHPFPPTYACDPTTYLCSVLPETENTAPDSFAFFGGKMYITHPISDGVWEYDRVTEELTELPGMTDKLFGFQMESATTATASICTTYSGSICMESQLFTMTFDGLDWNEGVAIAKPEIQYPGTGTYLISKGPATEGDVTVFMATLSLSTHVFACYPCISNAHCDDNAACTGDVCGATHECEHTYNHGFCATEPCVTWECNPDDQGADQYGCVVTNLDHTSCDDGFFCSGDEVCDPWSGCESEGDPCDPETQTCNEGTNHCDDIGDDDDDDDDNDDDDTAPDDDDDDNDDTIDPDDDDTDTPADDDDGGDEGGSPGGCA